MIYFIIYASSATRKFSEAELVELLKKSRENNSRLGITGMLLYKDGNFIQVLEGEKSAVQMLFKKINADPRHKGVLILLQETIEERQFPDWSMGFRNLNSAEYSAMEGYSEILNYSFTGEEFKSDPTKCQKLLLMFKKTMT